MTPETQTEKKPGFLGKLPKLSRTSQLIIFIGIFLIILIPLVIINLQQAPLQEKANKDLAILQSVLGSSLVKTADIEAEIRRAETEKANLISQFPLEGNSNLLMEQLMASAKIYNIRVDKLQVSSSKISVITSQNGTKPTDYPTYSIILTMKGQAAQFQNWLNSLATFPSCKISSVDITLAKTKGEDDAATVKLDIVIFK